MRMPFGRYRGMELREVPEDYLEWLLGLENIHDDLRYAVMDELAERGQNFSARSERQEPRGWREPPRQQAWQQSWQPPRQDRRYTPPPPPPPPPPRVPLAVQIGIERVAIDAMSELIENGYRCLAMRHHPDRGGDGTRMCELNQQVHLARESIQLPRLALNV